LIVFESIFDSFAQGKLCSRQALTLLIDIVHCTGSSQKLSKILSKCIK